LWAASIDAPRGGFSRPPILPGPGLPPLIISEDYLGKLKAIAQEGDMPACGSETPGCLPQPDLLPLAIIEAISV